MLTSLKKRNLFGMARSLLLPFLLLSLLSLSGCATLGANLALDLAKEEESKDCSASDPGEVRKIAVKDCDRISRLIKKAGITGGFVGYDQSGRIKLKGTYQNEDQIDLAFMLAITVVGVNSLEISPVTPRDLKEIKMVKTSTLLPLSEKKGNKFALLVGVSKFKQHIRPIETAVKDVKSIKSILNQNGFREQNIKELIDEAATKNNILAAMHELEDKVSANDSIVVYISTHGTSPDTFGKMGVIPYDLAMPSFKQIPNFNGDVQSFADKISKDETGDQEIIQIAKERMNALKTAVSFDNLLDFFTSIKTDKFVAILDTCYSGAALNTLTYPVGGSQYAEREKNYSQSQNTETKGKLLGSGINCNVSAYKEEALSGLSTTQSIKQCREDGQSKGLVLDIPNEPTTALANKNGDYEYRLLEDYRTLFQLPIGQQGKTIITATSGHEQSLFDTNKLPNSFFTYYLVKGLEKSKGQLFPAFDYAQIRTQKLVNDSFSCKKQTPEMVSNPNACLNLDLSK